jgi:preprotein translocase subunit YajC
MLKTSFTVLMMGPQGGGQAQSPYFSLIFILLLVFVFYFFMIRPQMKKQKDQAKFKESIQKGDKIVTIGGIHGKIAEVSDKTFVIEVEGGNRLKIEKSAVSLESTLAAYKKD